MRSFTGINTGQACFIGVIIAFISNIAKTLMSKLLRATLNKGSWYHTGADYGGQSYGSHVRYSKFKANEEFDISFQFKTFDKGTGSHFHFET